MISKEEVIKYLEAFLKASQCRYQNIDFDNLHAFEAPLCLFSPSQLSEKIMTPDFDKLCDLEKLYDFLFSHNEQSSFVTYLTSFYQPDIDILDYKISVIFYEQQYFVIVQQNHISTMHILLPQFTDEYQFQKGVLLFFQFLLNISDHQEIITKTSYV